MLLRCFSVYPPNEPIGSQDLAAHKEWADRQNKMWEGGVRGVRQFGQSLRCCVDRNRALCPRTS